MTWPLGIGAKLSGEVGGLLNHGGPGRMAAPAIEFLVDPGVSPDGIRMSRKLRTRTAEDSLSRREFGCAFAGVGCTGALSGQFRIVAARAVKSVLATWVSRAEVILAHDLSTVGEQVAHPAPLLFPVDVDLVAVDTLAYLHGTESAHDVVLGGRQNSPCSRDGHLLTLAVAVHSPTFRVSMINTRMHREEREGRLGFGSKRHQQRRDCSPDRQAIWGAPVVLVEVIGVVA